MSLLHAGVDTTVIALWLGHADDRSTNAYLHGPASTERICYPSPAAAVEGLETDFGSSVRSSGSDRIDKEVRPK